ncbi:beta-N-acetylhexosaminidase [Candidatus Bipolaricaulota bacterium]|nr:beta-N-acetylhexosaminidase [Candidatus Bipolaricaulota bacterium]MBS3825079.1 beta-N-acetylhexosaminidase [Candidatus Bipolaricaulota bacterium]
MIEWPGKLVMVGFQGTETDDHLRRMIEEFRVGGVILFRRNVVNADQVDSLTEEIQRIAKNAGYESPLIISIDQEGGMVNRIRDGITLSPGNMAIGAIGKEEIAREIGEIIGRELSSIGINMNLAPVLDLARSPSNHLGTRCFGEDPWLVGSMGRELSGGLADYGVSPVGKHFLGYGSSKTDPHMDLPRNNLGSEQLESSLEPFRIARDNLQGIMTAHIILDSIDSSPATLSAKVIKGLLREKIGFTGPVITDCLEMEAIQDIYGTGEAAVRAVKSGADLLVISHHQREQISAIRSLRRALTEGRLEKKNFEESWKRVNRISSTKPWNTSSSYSLEEDEERITEISGQTITALCTEGIPLKEGDEVLSINPKLSGHSLSPVQDREYGLLSVNSKLEEAGVGVSEVVYEKEVPDFRRLENQLKNCDKVIVLALEANSRVNDLAKFITREEAKMILVSLQNPWGFKDIPADSLLLTYGYSRPSLKGLADVLLGRIRPNSNPPVTL